MANKYDNLVLKHSCGKWTWKDANYCAWCGKLLAPQTIEEQIQVLTELMGCGPQLDA